MCNRVLYLSVPRIAMSRWHRICGYVAFSILSLFFKDDTQHIIKKMDMNAKVKVLTKLLCVVLSLIVMREKSIKICMFTREEVYKYYINTFSCRFLTKIYGKSAAE